MIRFKVETRGNSFVVYDLKENKTKAWFNSSSRSPEQRAKAERAAKEMNEVEKGAK